MMLTYHDTARQRERVVDGTDRCQSPGAKYDLAALVVDGCACEPESTTPINSAPLGSDPDQQAVYIYAVSLDFKIRIGLDGGRRPGKPNITKHETLWENAPLLAAGELSFLDGTIVDINSDSGSYDSRGLIDTSSELRQGLQMALQDCAIRISPTVERKLLL